MSDRDEDTTSLAHGDESTTAAAAGTSTPSEFSRKLELKRLTKLKKIRKYVPRLRTPVEAKNNDGQEVEEVVEEEVVAIDVDENSPVIKRRN